MDTQSYIIISSTILFILSETLPFIKSINGNSILEFVINCIKYLYKQKNNNITNTLNIETSDISDEETEPFINSDIKQLNLLIEKLLYRLDEENYRSMYLSSIDGQSIEMV